MSIRESLECLSVLAVGVSNSVRHFHPSARRPYWCDDEAPSIRGDGQGRVCVDIQEVEHWLVDHKRQAIAVLR